MQNAQNSAGQITTSLNADDRLSDKGILYYRILSPCMYNYAETKRKGYKGKEILKLGTTSALIVFEFFVFCFPTKKERNQRQSTHIETQRQGQR